MKFWREELTCGAETLREVPIKRGGCAITDAVRNCSHTSDTHTNLGHEFRTGKTINHLLFLDDLKLYFKSEMAPDSLIQAIRIFSEDIGM